MISKGLKPRFSENQHIDMGDFTIDFHRQSLRPKTVLLTGKAHQPVISVGSELDFDNPEVMSIISKLMCVVAKNLAPLILIPRARELAAGLGLQVNGWKITSGHRTLGTCTSTRVIRLSAINMFLPHHLRDYIIYHELAHLTHFNHSREFHTLCDVYMGGQEKQLINQLKHYNWPIIR